MKTYPQVPAVIQRWQDGDTCELVVQHMLTIPWRPLFKAVYLETTKLRLARINCPELKTPQGPAALARSAQLAPPGSQVTLTARGFEKYGRILGDLTLNTADDLATLLLAEGLAAATKGVPAGDWELL
jgi:endonuclease YncB( thermonuclease family)